MSKVALTVGLFVVAAIATFMLIEIFGGPVRVGNPNKQDPAYNPAGYGAQGGKVASTANQATNVLNTIGKDSSQVGADIKEVGDVASSVVNFFKNMGGGSSTDDAGPGVVSTDSSPAWANTNFADTTIA